MGEMKTNGGLCHNLKIRKGLDLKIAGEPDQTKIENIDVKSVALVGCDYQFMKPAFLVEEGDKVKLGQPLFTDRKKPEIQYTSPGAGKVTAIHRGERRSFLSIVIELSGNDELTFDKYDAAKLSNLKREDVKSNLLKSGLWTSIRNRPFSNIADPETEPHSIFVTAVDTNPHAPNPEIFIKEKEAEFKAGVEVLQRLTDGPVYTSRKAGSNVPVAGEGDIQVSGPHPAGNVGTHIHFVAPVSRARNVWYVNYQDAIAIGHLFLTGKILTERLVSLAGPTIKEPALVRTRTGASLDEITANRLKEGENRVVSGSLLSGYKAAGPTAYLGRFHNQVSALAEGRKREFLGWMAPGFNKFSIKNIFASKLTPNKKFEFDTSTHGSHRAMVPTGMYEKVMPLDIVPTFLLRSILMRNIEWAEELGVLELDEEDLALCTFVSTGKDDFGPILRENLTRIEKEG